MVGATRWSGVAAWALACLPAIVLAQGQQQVLPDPTVSFERVRNYVESITVSTPTPMTECITGVPCGHVMRDTTYYWTGVVTKTRVRTTTVTQTSATTITTTITRTKTVPGHDCTVFVDPVFITTLSTTTVDAYTTEYVTKYNTVTEQVIVYHTQIDLCTSSALSSQASATSVSMSRAPKAPPPPPASPSSSSDIYGSTILVETYEVTGVRSPTEQLPSSLTAERVSSTAVAYPIARSGTPPVHSTPNMVEHEICKKDKKYAVHIVHGETFDTDKAQVKDDKSIEYANAITFKGDSVRLDQIDNLFENGQHEGLRWDSSSDAIGAHFTTSRMDYTLQDFVLDLDWQSLRSVTETSYNLIVTINYHPDHNGPTADYHVVVPVEPSSEGRRHVTVSVNNLNIYVSPSMAISVSTSSGAKLDFVLKELMFCRETTG